LLSACGPQGLLECKNLIKFRFQPIDSECMSTTNELIHVIDSARKQGNNVKAIRKQKYAPSDFYMTLSDGKQVGPVKCQGDENALNGKFGEAQSYLAGLKNLGRNASAAA